MALISSSRLASVRVSHFFKTAGQRLDVLRHAPPAPTQSASDNIIDLVSVPMDSVVLNPSANTRSRIVLLFWASHSLLRPE